MLTVILTHIAAFIAGGASVVAFSVWLYRRNVRRAQISQSDLDDLASRLQLDYDKLDEVDSD